MFWLSKVLFMKSTNEEKSDYSALPNKVEVHTEENIQFWCKVFKCERHDLIQTIIKVGNSLVSVDAYLEMNRLKNTIK
jgi:hypothetical protein